MNDKKIPVIRMKPFSPYNNLVCNRGVLGNPVIAYGTGKNFARYYGEVRVINEKRKKR